MADSSKKRKWDQDDRNVKTAKVDTNPAKAASEAAARITAMLAKKGIPLDATGDYQSETLGEFVRKIPINDLKNRYMLIKGATQSQIQEETGAVVVTRGKYYPDKSLATDKDPALYLHVTASTKESLDKAIRRIDDLIETVQVPAPAPPKEDNHRQNTMKRPERKFFERILPVNITGNLPFNLRAKIVGPSGSYVKHINQETGCRVQLKGKGSGFIESSTGRESDEPLYVHLSCNREEGLKSAVQLTQHLLDTVKAEAEGASTNTQQYQYGYDNSGYNGYYDYNQSSTTENATADNSTAAYDYEAYNNYYNSYYSQQGAQGYEQYDANAYYNYYGYAPPTDENGTSAPPPPTTHTAEDQSLPPPPPAAVATETSSSSPPPPPPSSTSSPPPPPPPSS